MNHILTLLVILCISNVFGIAYTTTSYNNYTYSYSWYWDLPTVLQTEKGTCAITPEPTNDFTILFNGKEIGSGAFLNCKRLMSITIPLTYLRIRDNAFQGCSSLTNITFAPSSNIESISSSAFNGCTSLQTINIANNTYTNIEGVLYSTDLTTLVKFPASSHITELKLPDNITNISSYAFEDATNLVRVILPDNLIEIGTASFVGCSSLRNIDLPIGIKEIPESCFKNCISITSITHRCSNLSIASSAFMGCSNLEYFNMTNCTRISSYSFANSGLKNVYTLALHLGDYAFSDCSNITTVVITKTNIGNNIFRNCLRLNSFKQLNNGQDYYIGSHAFYGCKSLKSIIFNDGLTDVGFGAFSLCSSLENLTIPNYGNGQFSRIFGSEKYNEAYLVKPLYAHQGSPTAFTFYYTTNYYIPLSLKNIKLTQIKSIGLSAFEGCYTLKKVEFPETLTTIGARAFWNCWGLESITIPNSVISINTSDFADGNNKFSGIPFGGDSSITCIQIPSNIATIPSIFSSYEYITNIMICTKSSTILKGFCEGCLKLGSITIPKSITFIDDNAFKNCISLTKVIYTGNAPAIGGNNIYEGTSNELCSYVLYNSKGWDGDLESTILPSTWPTSITGSRTITHYIDPELQVITPIISPPSCEYFNPYLTVSIVCNDQDATIYYTTDGTDPNHYGIEYTKSFRIYKSTTVKAIAIKRDFYPSLIAQNAFTKSDELSEAGNLYNVSFDNDILHPWIKDLETSHDGISSIKSVKIQNNSSTEIKASIKKEGAISFWWRTKCEEPDYEYGNDGYYDFASFIVDNIEVARLAGEDSGWQFVKYSITTSGKHELKWRYQKDSITSFQPDCVWIDQIQWEPSDGTGCTYSTPVKVPFSWLRKYGYDESNFEVVANSRTIKTNVEPSKSFVWCDYLQGTDPSDPNDKFIINITIKDGFPVLNWTPYLNRSSNERTYLVRGKSQLSDYKWEWPIDVEKHRFFSVLVLPYDEELKSDIPGCFTPYDSVITREQPVE